MFHKVYKHIGTNKSKIPEAHNFPRCYIKLFWNKLVIHSFYHVYFVFHFIQEIETQAIFENIHVTTNFYRKRLHTQMTWQNKNIKCRYARGRDIMSTPFNLSQVLYRGPGAAKIFNWRIAGWPQASRPCIQMCQLLPVDSAHRGEQPTCQTMPYALIAEFNEVSVN